MSYYKDFSYYFDTIMEDVDYNLWIDFSKKYINLDNKILDLACGSGTYAIFLSLLGYNIDGCDLSSNLIDIATQKAKLNAKHINFFVCDMTNINTLDKYDVVTCFFDSINHLESYSDVEKTFLSVYNTLNDNGLFIFDIFSSYAVKICKNKVKGYADDFSYIWKTKKTSKNSLRHSISIKSENKKIKEIYNEYLYNVDELISKYFDIVNITGDFDGELTAFSGRILYVLKKK